MNSLAKFSLLTAIIVAAAPLATFAGEITSFTWFTGVASVAGEPVVAPPAPNNDATATTGTSPNPIIVYQKDYTAIGPVDLVFDVSDTGGVTEYAVSEGVQNSTGIDWTSYHIELGFGTGVDFVKSAPGDGLDFDAPSYDSTVDFVPIGGTLPWPTVTVTEDDIFASGGSHPNGAYAGPFIFHVDVPDGIASFTIRQSPVAVPEPTTTVVGLAWFAITYRRRRRMV